MKIALIGYGRMGREIEKTALAQGHTVTGIFDVDNIKDLGRESLSDSEVAIEFTRPDSAPANIISCFKAGIPVVSGTTGWLDSMPSVKEAMEKYSGTLFYASNFSLGVNLLFAVNRMVAGAMDKLQGYRPSVYEVHHTGKLDAPSGTALSLAEDIRSFTSWNGWRCLDREAAESVGEKGHRQEVLFDIFSERRGDVTGIHEVTWVSENDKISVRHEAFSRAGFVSGALLAAEYSINHKGLLTMQKLLGF